MSDAFAAAKARFVAGVQAYEAARYDDALACFDE